MLLRWWGKVRMAVYALLAVVVPEDAVSESGTVNGDV